MKQLELHISYLLSRHDCVVVPGFGGFVAQYRSASIDYERGVIVPPHRELGFNRELGHNDGTLAWSVARAEGMSYDQALARIAVCVAEMKRTLSQNGKLELDNIGVFTIEDGAMVFEPCLSPLIDPAYSLEPVEVISVKEAARREAIAQGTLVDEPSHGGFASFVRAAGRVAASVAVLVGLGILLSTPIVVDHAAPDQATVNPVTEITAPKTTSPTELLSTGKSAAKIMYLANTTEGYALVDTFYHNRYVAQAKQMNAYYDLLRRQQEERQKQYEAALEAARAAEAQRQAAMEAQLAHARAQQAQQRRFVDTDHYCLIVGSLTTQADAAKFIAENGDPSMRILYCDGKYRVCAATGETYEQVVKASTTLGRIYRGAWVMYR